MVPDHVRAGSGFVDEHEALWVHEALPHAPHAAVLGHVWPVLLGRPQRVFF
jgi:hypothetical protein